MATPMPYDPEIGDQICEWLIQGKSLKSCCERPDMPSVVTVFKWLRTSEEFANLYAQARDQQADTLADQLQEISDNPTGDVQRDRLRVDTRKWIASKLKPKKYGDRVEVEHAGTVKHVAQMTDEELEKIARQGRKED